MQAALRAAGLEAGAIDYINLHGTGTPSNDAPRARPSPAFSAPTTPCSSTKGATGHTLGAAGAIGGGDQRAGVCNRIDAGRRAHRAASIPTLTAHYIRENRRAPVARVLSNSFGFGGTNCSLIFGLRRMTIAAYVGGIGVLGPGLTNWPRHAGRAVGATYLRTATDGAAEPQRCCRRPNGAAPAGS